MNELGPLVPSPSHPTDSPTSQTNEARLPAGGTPSLQIDVRKSFLNRGGAFTLDVSCEVHSGITILFGASGAGKSTLLDCISGLVQPDSGNISIGDSAIFDSRKRVNVPVQHRKIGYVFQDLSLFPHLTVQQNLEYGLDKLPRKQRHERAMSLLESFRITHLAASKPRQISGGEQQRVALARALVTSPCVLLLDEPLAGLDAPTKSKIVDDLRSWNREHQIPILYVTHDREEVFALGEHVLVLEKGRLVAQGTPHEVMTAQLQETVAQLIGFENIFGAAVRELHPERGTMTCRILETVDLETPLVRAELGATLRVGIRAGDILVSAGRPVGLSARNLLPGRVVSLVQRDMVVVAVVDCGIRVEVHLTLAARDDLGLQPGRDIWLVMKTHSCHLLR